MEQKTEAVYVVMSATLGKMGIAIRWATRARFNHVSIACREDLRDMVSFARRYYRTPLYGGFVTEKPCRYHHNGVTADIRLYRLPLTQSQWQTLDTLLQGKRDHAERYLYNHLSALTAPLHIKIRVRDAFTCAEFAVKVLSALGFDFDPHKFYTLGAIARRLEPYHFYSGPFPVENEPDSSFFAPAPVPHPLLATSRSFLTLLWRKALSW